MTDTETKAVEQWDWVSSVAFAWRHRVLLCMLAGLIVAGTAVYNWLSPDQYTASAVLLPPRHSGETLPLASRATGMMATTGIGGQPGMRRGSELYPTIIQSYSVIGPLLKHPFPVSLDTTRESITLTELVSADDREEAIKRVRKLVHADVARLTGSCELSVTLADPLTAQAICNAFLDAMAARGVSLHTAGAARLRTFIARRMDTVRTELTSAEEELEQFRTRNRNYGYANNPGLQIEDARKDRQVELKSKLYLRLTQEYEDASLEERCDVADVRILDRASLPTIKSGPRRVRRALLAGVVAMPIATGLMITTHLLVFLYRRKPQLRDFDTPHDANDGPGVDIPRLHADPGTSTVRSTTAITRSSASQ